MATRTPHKQESAVASGDFLDKEWVTEHARQVSRMLPGGLCVLGVFIITESDSKDTLTTLRQLVFAVENLISSEHLWTPEDDDVTDCVTLHVNPKTRKTFDVKDPKSMAKPADWKYQSGVCSSWSMVSCCLNVDMLLPLPNDRTGTENMDVCVKEGLKAWADKIKTGFCLFDGKKLPEDTELTAGQKRNVRQKWSAQLLITPGERRQTDVIQQCGGSMSVRGTIHSRAYLHNNKPKAKLAEKMGGQDSSHSNQDPGVRQEKGTHGATLRAVRANHFSDEGLCEMTDRLKEMLDIDAAEEDLDTRQEMTAELSESNIKAEATEKTAKAQEVPEPKRNNFTGVAIATAAAVLAAAASMLYLNDV
nr:PREDICTED: protein odr-4 homolog [Paralichthys olivaceus]